MAQLKDASMAPISKANLIESLEGFYSKHQSREEATKDTSPTYFSLYLNRIDGIIKLLKGELNNEKAKDRAYDPNVTPYYYIHYITHMKGKDNSFIDYSEDYTPDQIAQNQKTQFEKYVDQWDIYSGHQARRESNAVTYTALTGTALVAGGVLVDAFIERNVGHGVALAVSGVLLVAIAMWIMSASLDRVRHASLDENVLHTIEYPGYTAFPLSVLIDKLPPEAPKSDTPEGGSSRLFKAERKGAGQVPVPGQAQAQTPVDDQSSAIRPSASGDKPDS